MMLASTVSFVLKAIFVPYKGPHLLATLTVGYPTLTSLNVGKELVSLPFYGGPEARASVSPHTFLSDSREKAL
ncbi:MAG: hypothetical protein HKN18_09570 [Silicimonas sp.]|nr:hypothetical protein [Silicimonas sp.]